MIDKEVVNVQQYAGDKILGVLVNETQREAFCKNYEHMKANYGDNVDFQLLDQQILLCQETKEILYSQAYSAIPDYSQGSRCELEKCVQAITCEAKTEREVVLGLMRFCRDLYKRRNGAILFYGGTEEELMKKGEQLCECLARLMTALCSIVRIPARIITHTIGGHLVCEVFLEGKWAYIDPRKGLYFQMPDNSLASVWELWHDHSLLDGQPASIRCDVSERFSYEGAIYSLKHRLLHLDEVITFKYYSLDEAGKYNYDWKTNVDLDANNLNYVAHNYRRLRCELFGLINEDEECGFEFSISSGQHMQKDTMVVAYPRGFVVAPVYVHFKVDGKIVWSTSDCVPVTNIHKDVRNAYVLGGDGVKYDFTSLSSGKHILRAECIGASGELQGSEVDFFT